MAEEQKDIRVTRFNPDQEVWIATKEDHMWDKVHVQSQNGIFVQVKQGKRQRTLNVLEEAVFPVNPKSQPDMTAMYFINEPCILMNLEERSLKDEPYTFMGNVLVAVNPLKNIPNPKDVKLNPPHPFSVAENAFKQLSFAYDHQKYHKDNIESINQSIVTSGESGAGKTEQCKMVLRHLVDRCSNADSAEIDKQLLESNYITESFGNAQTLRNHNSSRFGKFLKLFFQQEPVVKGHVPKWTISGATVATYLLERSRVVFHGKGERNYHIFYHILAGFDAGKMKAYGLDEASKACGFRYLSALESNQDSTLDKHVGIGAYKSEIHKEDKQEFNRVLQAMLALGFDEVTAYETFKVAAGILHLGNAIFEDKYVDNDDVAVPIEYSGYNAMKWAAELLGFDNEDVIRQLLLEERLEIRGKVIVKKNNKEKACEIRDAVGKGLYSLLFDHVIAVIDRTLNAKGANEEDETYIGVLDIFGFETFERNGFEQLLINFTNEALQATFNRSVFENEAALYKKERLVIDADELAQPPSNTACMDLFSGKADANGKLLAGEVSGGLLLAIDDGCQSIEPSDAKMLARLHRNFMKHPNYIKPHPKLKSEIFIIQHFAGKVSYTVGYFVEKNKDKLPKAVSSVFETSSSPILREIVGKTVNSKRNATIVKKFRGEIHNLVDTLESTNCSFIRCVKPNFHLVRPSNNKGWFERRYISKQLRNLSIPQTVEVLQNGFPTRLTYKSLLAQYQSLLPDSAMSRWSKSGGQEEVFVKALFYAFEVQQDIFKLGLTMVFFRSGELAKLDDILRAASNWKDKSKKEKDKIIERFIFYYTRMRWRRVFARMVAVNKFMKLLELVRERERIRKAEEERLRKEKEAREKAEAEALLKEQKEAEQAQQALQAAEKEMAVAQEEFETKYNEAMENSDTEDEEVQKIKAIDSGFVKQAEEEVAIELNTKEPRASVTSDVIRDAVEERVKNMRKKYAFENVRKLVDDSGSILVKTVDVVNKWILSQWEAYRPMREDADRRTKAILMVFIKEARKQKWFATIYDEIQRLSNEFEESLEKLEDKSNRIRKRPAVNMHNLKHTKSMLVISAEEARNPLLSSHLQVEHLDKQLQEGNILPNDYAEAAQTIKQSVNRGERDAVYQYTPKNSESEMEFSQSGTVVAPSDDLGGGWCDSPIPYKGGMLYIKPGVSYSRKNFTMVFGWEMETKKKKKLSDDWDVVGSAAEFASMYDMMLQIKKLKGKIPEFPTWDAAAYSKGKKKGLAKLLSRKDKDENLLFLGSCIDTRKLQEEPELIGNWMASVFRAVDGLVSKDSSGKETSLLLNTQIAGFTNCTTWAGLENM